MGGAFLGRDMGSIECGVQGRGSHGNHGGWRERTEET